MAATLADFAQPVPQRLDLGAQALVFGDDLLRAGGIVIQLGVCEPALERLDPRLARLNVLLDAGDLALALLPTGPRRAVLARAWTRGHGARRGSRRRDSRRAAIAGPVGYPRGDALRRCATRHAGRLVVGV